VATFIANGERMELLANVAQIVVFSVPIALLGAWVSSRGTSGMRGLVSPWRGDPWPIGVQEEDPDAPWGHDQPPRVEASSVPETAAARSAAIEDLPTDVADPSKPKVARLHGSVHRPH
jgi:hypothetical protein